MWSPEAQVEECVGWASKELKGGADVWTGSKYIEYIYGSQKINKNFLKYFCAEAGGLQWVIGHLDLQMSF